VFTVPASLTLSARVRAGVLALDFVEPLWFVLVDEHRLDVSSDTRCPLGQLWGRFSRGLRALGVSEDDAALFGFESPAILRTEAESEAQREYETLTRMWRTVVRIKMSGVRSYRHVTHRRHP